MINDSTSDIEEAIKKVKLNFIDTDFSVDSECDTVDCSGETVTRNTLALIKVDVSNQLVVTSGNVLVDKFESREYKGLVSNLDSHISTEISVGLFGTASFYQSNENVN